MSFAYYSSGERDEETGEYRKVSAWDKKFNEEFNKAYVKKESGQPSVSPVPPVSPVADLPKEFTFDYYNEKIAKYDKSSLEYWEWVKFKMYARAVLRLYEQTSIIFKQAFNLDTSLFDDYLNLNAKPLDLQTLVEELKTAEAALYNQFSKSRRTVQAKFNKHPTLARVKHIGAKSWMMTHAILNNVPLKSMRNFTQVYQNLDKTKDEDIVRAYRGYVILKRALSLYLHPKKLLIHSDTIYENENVYDIFNELCEMVGAYNTNDIEEIKESINPNLSRLEEDAYYGKIISFYSHYDDIHKTFYDIKKIAKDYYDGIGMNFDIFYDIDNGTEDIYQKGTKYLDLIKSIKELPNLAELFLLDLNQIEKLGETALTYASKAHTATHIYSL